LAPINLVIFLAVLVAFVNIGLVSLENFRIIHEKVVAGNGVDPTKIVLSLLRISMASLRPSG
jgi:hypothetical protein